MKQKFTNYLKLLLLLVMAPQFVYAKDPNQYFEKDRMMDKTSVGRDSYGNYLFLNFSLRDDHGTNRDDYLSNINVYVNNVNILNGYSYLACHNGNVRYTDFTPTFVNGEIYSKTSIAGNWSTSKICSNNTYSFDKDIKYIYNARLKYYFPELRFAKTSDTMSYFNFPVKFSSMKAKKECENNVYSINDQSKDFKFSYFNYSLVTVTNNGKIQPDGRILFTARTGVGTDITLNGLTVNKKAYRTTIGATANKTYTYSFSHTVAADKNLFLNGEKFQIIAYVRSSPVYTKHYLDDTDIVTTEKIALFNNDLSLTNMSDGNVKLNWSMTQPTSGGDINMSSFKIEVSTDNVNWKEVPNPTAYVTSKTKFEYTYAIPESEWEKGRKTYYFRINREGFNIGAFQTSKNIEINTNYKRISIDGEGLGISAIKDSNTAEIKWNLDDGLWVDNFMSYKLYINDVTTIDIAAVANGNVVTSYIIQNIASCEKHKYELRLFSSKLSNPISTQIIAEDFLINNTAAEILTFEASKGYYSGRVVLNWTLDKNKNDFTKFEIYRKDLSSTTAEEILLQEISHDGIRNSYNIEDNSADAGVYYSYVLKGIVKCSEEIGIKSTKNSIGFSQPHGTAAGRVTYTGSQAVQDVEIIFEGKDDFSNRSLYFKEDNDNFLSIPTNVFNDKSMTFQAWLNIKTSSDYRQILKIEAENNPLQLRIKENVLYLSLGETNLLEHTLNRYASGTYFHLSLVYKRLDNNNVQVSLYIDGEHALTQTVIIPELGLLNNFYIGAPDKTNFIGYLDEVRFWNKDLNPEEINADCNRYLNGKETGLIAYYRLDEPNYVLGIAYDCSAVNSTYNKNHAIVGSKVLRSDSNITPTKEQLALKAVTDSDGNYLINNIPYVSDGSSYSVTPSFGVHTFNPNSKPLYVSSDANTFNNFDFTDISSFKVSGKVVYEGGNYPVEGCSFQVDGKTLVDTSGNVITSNNDGSFTIEVPIGKHEVRVTKSGHTFAYDGKILDANNENINYNSDLTLLAPLQDQTRVKVIGRVTGGLNEHKKVLGFGESLNNIGVEKITLTPTLEQYDLMEVDASEIYTHNTDQWKKADGLVNDTTKVTLKAKSVVVNISPETGEFVAWLPPVAYFIEAISAKGYVRDIYNARETLDLTNTPMPDDSYMQTSVRQWTEIKHISGKDLLPGELPYDKTIEMSDTVKYHAKWQHYYQAVPSFSMIQLSGTEKLPYFGDKKYTYVNSDSGISEDIPLLTIDEKTQNVTYTFGQPVFTQGTEYKYELSAFEVYTNNITNVNDTARVSNGTIEMSNELPYPTSPDALEINLDSLGVASYEFTAGLPDLTTGSKNIYAILKIGDSRYNWNFGPDVQRVWVFGSVSTGTDFLTTGPDHVEIILRDPPGSKSFAYIESGTSVTSKNETTAGVGNKLGIDTEVNLGGEVVTFIGIGGGVVLKTEVSNTVHAGGSTEEKFNYGSSSQTKTTYTERFETSSDPFYVGHLADVFVGYSTNILYGLANTIKITKGSNEDSFEGSDRTIGASTYSIGKATSVAVGEKFATRFAYTLIQLERIVIPKWKSNLNLILKDKGSQVDANLITSPVYVSKLDRDDKNFGKINSDEAFGENASDMLSTDDGPSYKIIYPTGFFTDDNYKEQVKTFQDSIMYYNNQINMWTDILVRNEREKTAMKKSGNYSFDSGSKVKISQATSSTTTNSYNFNWVMNAEAAIILGAKINGIGCKLTTKSTTTIAAGYSDTSSEETSGAVGFVLEEQGFNDQISVDYGFYQPSEKDSLSEDSSGGTFIFKTQGGRTSCPYEDEYVTKYFEPGKHILSNATMQIEVPKIDVSSAKKLINVPANQKATFILDLKNESEVDKDIWFQLIVDEVSNPDGAELRIDRQTISNGRLFLVKAGEVLQKTLTVSKGTNADIYEDIRIILRSECQHNPTGFLENIGDTTTVSVSFIPASSDIVFNKPVRNWISNTETGDSLQVVLTDFDVNFENFGYIGLEYRSTSAAAWNTIMKFYPEIDKSYEDVIYKNATGKKMRLVTENGALSYWWNQKDMTDGAYEIRAYTTCIDPENPTVELSRNTIEAMTGIKDMKKPQPLGNPSPANGILGFGDEISILFNEDIRTGMVSDNQISISGVLNETTIDNPSVGLNFAGTGIAYTEMPITTGGSFSIESWFKRTPSTAGTLFAFGANGNCISIGFNTLGNAVLKLGENTYTSGNTIINSDEWKYISLMYDATHQSISVYLLEETQTTALFDNLSITSAIQPEKQGRLYMGAMADKSNAFNGVVSNVHFWNMIRTSSDISSDKDVLKTGKETGLIGYWLLNEGKGISASDKARNRHLTLETDWYIYPQGLSAKVSGNDYLSFPSSNFRFREHDDFSIEFWFKGADQTSATLFSVGQGIKDTYTAGELSIAVNENKALVLRSLGEENIITTNPVLDNQWHHFALSVKRNGTSNIYMDGILTKQLNSSLIGNVEGVSYSFGAGCFDDIRIWNAALTSDVIDLNMNHKLTGKEDGLMAYYPFDKYETSGAGIATVMPSINDFVTDTLEVKGFTANADVPAIIDVRPATIIPYPSFSYVTSNNKIVIDIDDSYRDRIEGAVLEISVKDIYDLQNNKSNVQKWTVFVNQNPLMWEEDSIDLVMEEGTSQTFTATITNKSGETANYIIDNLPDWLTVSQSQGSLKATAGKTLTFTIAKGTDIGTYENAISLTSESGLVELLPITLKVTGERPDWIVDPHDFSSSMSLVGVAQIENAPQEDEDDLVGAFIGDLCVGVASPMYVKSHNAYYVFMNIHGNNVNNEQIVKFKLWDASTGRIYPQVLTTQNQVSKDVVFTSGGTQYSQISSPMVLNAQGMIEQQISLQAGWNWFSVNVENEFPDLLTQIKTQLSGNGIELKSQTDYLKAVCDNDWDGTMTDVSVAQTYLVSVVQNQVMKLQGTPASVSGTSIPLFNGWNWIGYTPQLTTTVQSALAGISSKNDDQIKAQTGFNIYDTNNGWIGSLDYMQPGKGYMYYSENANNMTFTYPNETSSLRSSTILERNASNDLHWDNLYNRFANNMTMTSIAFLDDVEIESEMIEIGAFAGDDCRGNTMLSYRNIVDRHIGFLMIYGNAGDEINFRMYNHETGEEYMTDTQKVTFTPDDSFGKVAKPYELRFYKTSTPLDNISVSGVSIYPNPATTVLNIKYDSDKLDSVEVIDMRGRSLMVETNFSDTFINVSNLAEGVYLLRLVNNGKLTSLMFRKM